MKAATSASKIFGTSRSVVVRYADFECKTVPIVERTKAKNVYKEYGSSSNGYKAVYRLGLLEDGDKLSWFWKGNFTPNAYNRNIPTVWNP